MDISTAASALQSIQGLAYSVIFLLFILEGPILNYVAAFAASLGAFNVFIILGLAIAGNVIGDVIYYYVGKFGKHALAKKRITKMLESNKIKKIEDRLKTWPGRTLAIIKLVPPLTPPGLLLAGVVNMPFKKYLMYSIIISAISCTFFTLLGYFSGKFFYLIYSQIKYWPYVAGITIALILIGWFIVRYVNKKLSKKAGL
jgi:membrane protein DedA with SNARE-associated domain